MASNHRTSDARRRSYQRHKHEEELREAMYRLRQERKKNDRGAR